MGLLDSVKSRVTSTYQDAKSAVSDAATTVKNKASDAADTVSQAASTAVTEVKNTASSAATTVQQTASSAVSTVKTAVVTAESKAGALARHAYDTGAGAVQRAVQSKAGGGPSPLANQVSVPAGGAKDAAPAAGGGATGEINDKLSYKWNDWAVTDKDVKAVHDQLEGLPPAEYKAQIDSMQKDGKLDRYISNMTPAARAQFLDQASRKGMMPGGQAKVPGGPCDPPKGPVLYDNKTDLPPEMRKAIHENNLDNAADYDKRYGQYMDRYNSELDKCKNPEEMRKLGHWAPKLPLGTEPGYDNSKTSDPLAKAWADERYDKTRGDKSARELAAKKMQQFTGRQPIGDVFIEAEVGAKVTYTAPTGTTGGYAGKLEGQAGSSSGLHGDGKHGAHVGQNAGPVKTSVNAEETEVEVAGQSVSVDKDGKVEAKFTKPSGKKESEGPVHGDASVGPYGSIKADEARYASGAHGKAEGDIKLGKSKVGGEVSAKVGVGVRGITADEAYESIRPGPGFWSEPTELQQGTSWSALPPETQERYSKHYGWTQGEWDKKAAAHQK